MNMEQEMEMTRDELNKMTKRDLIEHIAKHGKKPQRKNILKGNLIDLIIKEGFNRPPPEIPKEEVTSTEIQVRQHLPELNFRIVSFSREEITKCKTRAEVDDLVDKKMAGPIRIFGEGELNQLD
jgi:hypothetical protein